MTYSVFELPRSKADKRHIFEWLIENSTPGAKAWLAAYDSLIERLKTDARVFSEAFENKDCPELDVRQAFFKTRSGRRYRLLYFIEGNDVYVLRVRGPGQAPVNPANIR